MPRSLHDALFRCLIAHPDRADDWLFRLFPTLPICLRGEPGKPPGRMEALDPTLLSHILDRQVPDLVWRHSTTGVLIVGEHQTRADPQLGARLFRAATTLCVQAGQTYPPTVVGIAIIRNGRRAPNYPHEVVHGSLRLEPLLIDLKTANLDVCVPGVARAGLRMLRAALRSHQRTLWHTLADCLIEMAQAKATATEIKQLSHYAQEVSDCPQTEADQIVLRKAHEFVITCYPAEVTEEVVMGKWKRSLLAEGRQEGRKEGRQEGLVIGLTQAAQISLEARFGPLPPWVVARLDSSTIEDLKVWIQRATQFTDLEQVFQ